jgi:WD40 repeat protein
VLVDDLASVIVASSTDKFVSIYEGATGQLISRFTCGEITTAMCMSTNMKHIITTSADGIIYIWRLPESLTKALSKVEQDNILKEQEESINPQEQNEDKDSDKEEHNEKV